MGRGESQASTGGAVRNPYASRYAAGSNIVVLEPDVAAIFPELGLRERGAALPGERDGAP